MSRSAHRRRRLGPVLALLAFAQLLIALDYNIVYVALPEIGRTLAFSDQTLQWVVSAYAVAFGGFLLLGGRAADLLGRRRMFVLALGLYGAASLVGGLAESPGPLVAARAVQGLGGALLFPTVLSLVNTTFAEGPERNRALAVWGAAGGSGLAVGALLGGVLTGAFGWESVFYVNVPLAAISAALAFPLLAPDGPRERGRSFDLPGALLATAGITLLVFAFVQAPEWGWASAPTLGSLALAGALLAAFAAVERRGADPLMPLRLLANRSLTTAMSITLVHAAGLAATYYLFTVHVQQVLGFSALQAGLAFLPLALLATAGTKIAERVVTRVGIRPALLAGLGLGVAGDLALGLGLPTNSFAGLIPGILLFGLGMGTTWTTMWIAAAEGVSADEQGVASGTASTTNQIGLSVGTAVLVAVAGAGSGGLTGAVAADLTRGLQFAYFAAAAVTTAGVLIALRVRARPAAVAEPAAEPVYA